MISFLLKGLIRDRSRSLFPVLITAAGVALTVFMAAYGGGILGQMIETTAKFQTGHVTVKTKALADHLQTNPMESALTNSDHWLRLLKENYPNLYWKYRISFGGLLDVPDKEGETLSQAPVIGMALDLLSGDGVEAANLNLNKSITKGSYPARPGEILISDAFFEKLDLKIGQNATLISSDMNGAMVVYNFKVAGTVVFGVNALDRGAIIADVTDIQQAFDMVDATLEIYGFFKNGSFQEAKALQMQQDFNFKHLKDNDIFSPVMMTLKDNEIMGYMLEMAKYVIFIIAVVFIFIVSIVLWNAGLMSGIRRYGEIGIRLAIGESKNHLYLSLLLESVLLGLGGYILGTVIGLIPAYLLQKYGLNLETMMQSSDLVMPNIVRAKITGECFWIGLIPGVAAPFLGTLLSGLVVYKRQTAQLFKELEV